MKYCEKCNAVFGNQKEGCPHCKRKLTSNIFPENWVYMATATGFELERISAALNTAEIPFTLKSEKKQVSMRLLNSAPMENCDVLVPIFAYDDAYDVLTGINAIDSKRIPEPDDELKKEIQELRQKHNDDVDSMSPRKRKLIKIFSTIGFIILLALIVWGVDYLLIIIKQLFGIQ